MSDFHQMLLMHIICALIGTRMSSTARQGFTRQIYPGTALHSPPRVVLQASWAVPATLSVSL